MGVVILVRTNLYINACCIRIFDKKCLCGNFGSVSFVVRVVFHGKKNWVVFHGKKIWSVFHGKKSVCGYFGSHNLYINTCCIRVFPPSHTWQEILVGNFGSVSL